ncbi:hypothetical protein BDA96_02G048000 [Sorghum bicolor]|uniref:Uncharacterized protein n=1 Tax=Sorghum bicolor TaxID=4558 RepID=A0A921RL95_SORBI|nr:hypothetical protein BDA96_02G048000 [Sorghum bicolor]
MLNKENCSVLLGINDIILCYCCSGLRRLLAILDPNDDASPRICAKILRTSWTPSGEGPNVYDMDLPVACKQPLNIAILTSLFQV